MLRGASPDGAGPAKSHGPPRFTIYDLRARPEARRPLRDLPRLVAMAVRVVWSAGKREFLASSALQLVNGIGLGGLILVGKDVLAGLIVADQAGGAVSELLPSALVAAAVIALLGFLSAVQREQQRLLAELTTRYTLARILKVASAIELKAFETPAFHDRLLRARTLGQAGPMNLVMGLSGLIGAVAGAVGALVALLALEPVLALFAMLVFVPAWLVSSRRAEAFYRFAWRLTPRDRERNYLARLLTDRDPAKEVRAFGLANFLRERHERLHEERLAELRRVLRRQLLYSLLANVGIFCVLGGALALLVALTLAERISLAGAAAAATAIVLLGQRLVSAGFAAGALYESALFLDDYRTFLTLSPSVEAARPRGRAPRSFSRIVADNVSFTYPSGSRPALRDVSLHIDEGEMVALVGENGSGKTTLAKLLTGLYVPDAGRVLWDGMDISVISREALRRSVAVIFQDFIRYVLSARDNIGLGRHERINDLEGIATAALKAGIDPDLRRLQKGYETLLGPEFEGGTELSVGQWQRLALARAFFRDAPFVILDEPTAALDAKAEHELFVGIRQLLSGRSVLLISHRFSSVRSADRIYVLSEGEIVEHGTHNELMARGGLYAELFSLQAAAYVDRVRVCRTRRGPDL